MDKDSRKTDHDYPLTPDETRRLGLFNSQVGEGLVHRPGYAYEMAKLQDKVNAWVHQQNEESGYDAWAAAQSGTDPE